MRADHEAHRQRLAGRRARLVDRAQIARGDEIDAGLAPPAQHQPAHADIGEAGARIDHEIDRGRDVGPAVGAMAEMHRQLGEIGLVAGQHDLLHGRFGARDLEDLRLVAQPALDLRHQAARLDPEGAREPGAAAGDVGDEFLPLRARRRGTARRADCLPAIGATSTRSSGSLWVSSSLRNRGSRRTGAAGSDRSPPRGRRCVPVLFRRCPSCDALCGRTIDESAAAGTTGAARLASDMPASIGCRRPPRPAVIRGRK